MGTVPGTVHGAPLHLTRSARAAADIKLWGRPIVEAAAAAFLTTVALIRLVARAANDGAAADLIEELFSTHEAARGFRKALKARNRSLSEAYESISPLFSSPDYAGFKPYSLESADRSVQELLWRQHAINVAHAARDRRSLHSYLMQNGGEGARKGLGDGDAQAVFDRILESAIGLLVVAELKARGFDHVLEDTQALRVHLSHLRRKIEEHPSTPRYIVTEPGVGYRFVTR